MNGQYMMRMPADELYPHLVPFLGEQARSFEELRPVIELHKSRARTLKEMVAQMEPFFAADDAIVYDPEAEKKHLKGDDLAARMQELHDALAAAEPFDVATTEHALRALAESRGLSAAKYIHPLRLALTGRGASPPIFDVAVVLGKERTLARLQRLISRLQV
jgi:glutamyl-tRNA synthetase